MQLVGVHLKLVTVFEVDRVHHDMSVYVVFVLVRCDKYLEILENRTFFDELRRYVVSKLRRDFLVRRKALNEMLVRAPARLVPKLFCELHFLGCGVGTLQVISAYQLAFGLFRFSHIVDSGAYRCAA